MEKKEWQWEEDKVDTPEEKQGKIAMLTYLILHSYCRSSEDMDNDRQGWEKEELEKELSKLTNMGNTEDKTEQPNEGWQWEEDNVDTPEEKRGKIAMLTYLILHSHYSSLEDMDNDRQGWEKEELEKELSKLDN